MQLRINDYEKANDNGHTQREPPSDIMTEGIVKRKYAIETGIASTATHKSGIWNKTIKVIKLCP